MARAAALLGAKNTAYLIPYFHAVSIDALKIDFAHRVTEPPEEIRGMIAITAQARSIGRVDLEMVALTAVSVATLVIYDLLKVVDRQLEITGIALKEKTGGKNDRRFFRLPPRCTVLVCSDATVVGKRADNSGKVIVRLLEESGASVVDYRIVPDDRGLIQAQIKSWVEKEVAFIFTTGGTGLGSGDHAVDAVSEMLERDADGITQAMRHYGQQRTPLAMMSRAVAGSIGHTTVVTLPGSSDGARQSLEAILPAIFHARKILKGGGH